jgi:mRNA interferase RelE/StbE
VYKVIWASEAEAGLKKIADRTTAENIRSQVAKHLTTDPFWNGKPLKGRWRGFWRLHLADYRAIYEIVYEVRAKEKELIVAVVKIGKRQDIYGGELLRSTSNYRFIDRPKVRDLKRKVVGRAAEKES